MKRMRHARKVRGRPPEGKATIPCGYVAMHSTDATKCLASGFLSPWGGGADEEKRVCLNLVAATLPVEAALLELAMGSRDYGFPLVAEVRCSDDGSGTPGTQPRAMEFPIPIAHVMRLLFRSDEDRIEFDARASGYADVPIDACLRVVSKAAFGDLAPGGGLVPMTGTSGFEEALLSRHLKIGGALAAHLAAVRSLPCASVFDWIKGFTGSAGACSTLPGLLVAIVETMCGDDGVSAKLMDAVGRIIDSSGAAQGFQRHHFFEHLSSNADRSADEGFQSYVGRFIEHAETVASAKRELPDDAFAEAEGKIAARALLLFVLNPEADRLVLARRRIKNLGPRVYFLAAAIAGGFSGLAKLPVEIKAPDRQAFLGLTLLVSKLARAQEMVFSESVRWDRQGSRVASLVLEGFEVLRLLEPPPALLELAKTIAAGLGLEPRYSEARGELEVLAQNRELPIRLRAAEIPAWPRGEGLRATILVASKAASRKLARVVGEIGERSAESGIFARLAGAGQERGIEVFGTCLAGQVNAKALSELVTAVSDAATAVGSCLAGNPPPTDIHTDSQSTDVEGEGGDQDA